MVLCQIEHTIQSSILRRETCEKIEEGSRDKVQYNIIISQHTTDDVNRECRVSVVRPTRCKNEVCCDELKLQ